MGKKNERKKENSFLASIDKFAPEVTLNFEKKPQFGTNFGGMASIMTILLFVIIVF